MHPADQSGTRNAVRQGIAAVQMGNCGHRPAGLSGTIRGIHSFGRTARENRLSAWRRHCADQGTDGITGRSAPGELIAGGGTFRFFGDERPLTGSAEWLGLRPAARRLHPER
jgi:hypothetical protein